MSVGDGELEKAGRQIDCRKPGEQRRRPKQGDGSGTSYKLEAEEKGNGRVQRGALAPVPEYFSHNLHDV